jgi:DNA invertase Pin-like site-specific DNA recombinase
MRCAIYTRVSTDDGRQEVRNQGRELTAYAERMGWTVVGEYADHISGRKAVRPEFQRVLADARSRRFDVLLFWSLDRISREGALKTLSALNVLTGYGVKYRSLQESYVDSLGPFGEAIVGLIATISAMESLRISARIKSGLARAKEDGKQLGRRRVILDRAKLADMRAAGLTIREIAEKVGASAMTVQRSLRCAPVSAGTP